MVYPCMYMPWYSCSGQKTAWGNWFFPSTLGPVSWTSGVSLGSQWLYPPNRSFAVLNVQILGDKVSASSGSSDWITLHSLNNSPVNLVNVPCDGLLGGLGDEIWRLTKLALDTDFSFHTVVNFLTFHSKYIMLMLTLLLMAVRSCASRH